jgi:hypothetical protein
MGTLNKPKTLTHRETLAKGNCYPPTENCKTPAQFYANLELGTNRICHRPGGGTRGDLEGV